MRALWQRGRALLGEHLARRALILVYHSIEDTTADPFGMHVSPEHFDAHLDVVRRRCTPLSVGELVRRARAGSLPLRPIALSFDDGYANNLHAALPLLDRHDVPATFFIMSGFIDSADECWWDALERMLLLPGELQQEIVLRLGDTEHRWWLGDWARLTPEHAARWNAWAPWQAETPTPRHDAFRTLIVALQHATLDARRAAMDALHAQTISLTAPRTSRRGLTGAELRTLASHRLTEIGAHTVQHPSLASLSESEQRREINASRTVLRVISGQPVNSFAYPYGRHGDYSPETVRAVRDAGFDAACINEQGYVKSETDALQLPRFWVANWDGPTFEGYLSKWLAEAYGD